jgi:hypothetical protein
MEYIGFQGGVHLLAKEMNKGWRVDKNFGCSFQTKTSNQSIVKFSSRGINY